ncbi:hypothetical protein [Cylindrospermopsis raciborskii]|uniref:hypothetical protein n=1 Tax=Cylindrospermopsis raciborskii TaxID=77022 RepID=UPI000304B458|nr:hypothetical protein [Cylindrospermopsis raciborskii]
MHSRRAIAFRHYPPVSSQGKILKVLKGDRIALPTGDCSHTALFYSTSPLIKD